MAFICGSHLPVPRPLLQPTDRPATCPFLPLPSHLTGAPPPINMHRIQLTHSFIHLAAARFHGLSARKPGPNESEPPHQNPRTAPIQYHPTVQSRPNQTKTVQTDGPTGSRSRCMPLSLSGFQPFQSALPPIWVRNERRMGGLMPPVHRITPVLCICMYVHTCICAYALVCAPTCVHT